MSGYILPGVLGLLLGLTLRWTRLGQADGLRQALALRISHALRSLLFALGAGMAMTALLCWLAVIDVDGIVVLPLSAGVLAGGGLFGAAAALAGFTPLTAFAGVAGKRPWEALCVLAGCLVGTLLLPLLDAPLAALQGLPPHSATTLFAVTLDEPWLLGGGFLGQGCAGLLMMSIAACIPSNRRSAAETPEPAPPDAPKPPDDPPAPPLPAPPPLLRLPAPQEPLPEDAQEETFIALLPGEEPLVVDTAQNDDEPSESPEPAHEPE